ncbi:MAG: DinB family protein [Balneolaceae bacterium]|nr:DinB family protein [Balneolaceae bacterium]
MSSHSPPYSYRWYIDRFAAARDRAVDFGQPIDQELFLLRPSEHQWSIAECFSHLVTFGDRYLQTMQQGTEAVKSRAQPVDEDLPFPPRLLWKGVINLFAPPYRLKMKTVEPFSPNHKVSLKKASVLDRFVELQEQFIAMLEDTRTEGIHMDQVKVSNPILSFIKMTLSECFAVIEVHQRRHLWQAEQVYDKLS